MRKLMHLLVIFTLLLCGSHLSPAKADALNDHVVEAGVHTGQDDESPDGPHTGAAHGGHHHCPIAPVADAVPALQEPMGMASLLFARRVAHLRSLATAPPTQPPAA